MKQLVIAGVEFNIMELDGDKLLLQCQAFVSGNHLSIPLIGEFIVKEQKAEIINIVAAENELLIYVDEEKQQQVLEYLQTISMQKITIEYDPFVVEVCFELGSDWEDVNQIISKSKEEIIDLILSRNYPLINYGFQPGFMYLDKLEDVIHVPRKEKPRLKVPAGSLAIGGKYIGIYGSESPGGWNVIGRTSHKIDNNNERSKFPSIGQEIKFIRLDKNQYLRKYENE